MHLYRCLAGYDSKYMILQLQCGLNYCAFLYLCSFVLEMVVQGIWAYTNINSNSGKGKNI